VFVREAAPGDEEAIAAVCASGFAASSAGLLPPARIAAQASSYYDPARVRTDLHPAPPTWLGYVVAEVAGEVVGAAGGGVDGDVGRLLVLYLELSRRHRGIGTALLDRVTAQQRTAGATRQRVWVTEGNEMALPFYDARGFTQADREPFTVAEDGEVEAWSLVLERAIA
jgi:GNAT superfamily N-acetyltransferase